jgi:hypothetical protein
METEKTGKTGKTENQKTFSDLTLKSWFMDKTNIKVGESFSKMMSGESLTLDVKEILFGSPYKTWIVVITKDEKVYLLKSSRELK